MFGEIGIGIVIGIAIGTAIGIGIATGTGNLGLVSQTLMLKERDKNSQCGQWLGK